MSKDFHIHLTESQCDVLKAVVEASGEDTLDEYLQTTVIQGLQSDTDLYFGHSKAIKEKLYKKLEEKQERGPEKKTEMR